MNGKAARYVFLGICIILAILLLTKIIAIILGGVIFAAVLVILGVLSQGFKRKNL